jgi:hypothetical protein
MSEETKRIVALDARLERELGRELDRYLQSGGAGQRRSGPAGA